MMGDHNVNGQTSRRSGRKRPPNEDDLTDEERCKKQKNREAAKRCRLRKIEESQNLKKQNEELENQNRQLTKKKVDLEQKIKHCIRVIQHHQRHGCQLPDDVQRILNSDSERFSCSDESTDFVPVGTHTIQSNQNMSTRLHQNEALSIQILENSGEMTHSDSGIPTGLFSGAEIQMDQSKIRVPKSLCPIAVATQKKDMDAISDSQMKIHTPHGMTPKPSNSVVCQIGYLQAEEGEGHYQSSSPVQRVPNIDQIPWSCPSSKSNGGDESGDEEYSYVSRSDASIDISQSVSQASSLDKLCGGFMISNAANYVAQNHISKSQTMDNEVKPFLLTSNANTALKPLLASYQTGPFKQSKSSVTQSLQATTELISQAIHDIDPSEISQSFHAQIVECAKPDSAVPFPAIDDKDYLIPVSSSSSENQEEIPHESYQQLSYEGKPQHLQVIHHQTDKLSTEGISNTPTSYGTYTVYGNANVDNSNILPNSFLSPSLNEISGMHQNYIITEKSVEHSEQAQVVALPMGLQFSVLVNAAGQIQQSSQPVEEIVKSQIPTTVFNVEENETTEPEQNARENEVSSHAEHVLESTENVNVTSSADNYSANVTDLPSLSFLDLQNTPKEIFDKKPSRLRSK